MPKSHVGSSAPADSTTLEQRVLEAERRTLDYWVSAVTASANGSMTVRAIQSSMSWRVTRPLRAATTVYRRLREAGVRKTMVTVRARLAEERRARQRG